jgi:hypothetical protein
MSLVSIPFTFVANTRALASQVNADFAAVRAVLNGALTDVNFAAGADLDANKLSSSPGKRVSAAKMESNSVDDRVLASSLASDALRAVSGDHMKALTIAQVARIIPAISITNSMLIGPLALTIANASIASEKLKLTVHTVTGVNSGSLPTPNGSVEFGTAVTANPTSTFTTALYDLLGVYVVRTDSSSKVLAAPFITNVTNWGGGVRFINYDDVSASGGCSLVYVFLAKT